jgi:hypothetical protein
MNQQYAKTVSMFDNDNKIITIVVYASPSGDQDICSS